MFGASSSRAPEARRGQNGLNGLFEDQQRHASRNGYSIHPVINQFFNGPVTFGHPPFRPPMPNRRTAPRPHSLPLQDEEPDEWTMVRRQQDLDRNLEMVGEERLDSPSPGLEVRNSNDTNSLVDEWMDAVDASESQSLATDPRQHHAALRYAALRKSYKEELLHITRAWPRPPTEDYVRSLIKLDDERDNLRQFATRIDENRIERDWRHYEVLALTGKSRNADIAYPVYEERWRNLDLLKIWVNLNQHWDETWPPGYTPRFPDLNAWSKTDDISSVCTYDQESIIME